MKQKRPSTYDPVVQMIEISPGQEKDGLPPPRVQSDHVALTFENPEAQTIEVEVRIV